MAVDRHLRARPFTESRRRSHRLWFRVVPAVVVALVGMPVSVALRLALTSAVLAMFGAVPWIAPRTPRNGTASADDLREGLDVESVLGVDAEPMMTPPVRGEALPCAWR